VVYSVEAGSIKVHGTGTLFILLGALVELYWVLPPLPGLNWFGFLDSYYYLVIVGAIGRLESSSLLIIEALEISKHSSESRLRTNGGL